MNKFTLKIPDSLMDAARDFVENDDTSMNQFFVVAIGEKISALKTEQFFKEKSALADEEAYLQVLAKVNNNPLSSEKPESWDDFFNSPLQVSDDFMEERTDLRLGVKKL